ncbi:MAG: energy transducer TonB, partial [Saprospiraceae bacterium]
SHRSFVTGKASVFHHRPALLRIGFAAALALMILAFSWTKYEANALLPDGWLLPDVEDLLISPPQTNLPPPILPPKLLPAIEIVPDDISTESVVFTTTDIAATDPAGTSLAPAEPVATEPPPRPVEQEENDILLISEVSPNFPGCEEIADDQERQSCANQKLLKFIYENIRYPAAARDIGIEGTVVVRFVVEKDGSITQTEVLRDSGGGLGGEVLRVVQMMPAWHPGRQHGRPVRVRFNLPVKFKLQ